MRVQSGEVAAVSQVVITVRHVRALRRSYGGVQDVCTAEETLAGAGGVARRVGSAQVEGGQKELEFERLRVFPCSGASLD